MEGPRPSRAVVGRMSIRAVECELLPTKTLFDDAPEEGTGHRHPAISHLPPMLGTK